MVDAGDGEHFSGISATDVFIDARGVIVAPAGGLGMSTFMNGSWIRDMRDRQKWTMENKQKAVAIANTLKNDVLQVKEDCGIGAVTELLSDALSAELVVNAITYLGKGQGSGVELRTHLRGATLRLYSDGADDKLLFLSTKFLHHAVAVCLDAEEVRGRMESLRTAKQFLKKEEVKTTVAAILDRVFFKTTINDLSVRPELPVAIGKEITGF